MFTEGIFRACNAQKTWCVLRKAWTRGARHKSPRSAEWPLDEWRAHFLPNEKLQEIISV